MILRPVVLSDGAMTIALKDVHDAWRSLYGNTNNNHPDASGYAMQGLQITGVPVNIDSTATPPKGST